MSRLPLALLLAASALAGCAGADASTPLAAAVGTPSLPCTVPYGTRVALLSPAPGTSGVAAGSAAILIVASRELPASMTLVATDRKGRVVAGSALERVPPPAHASAPGYRHPVYYRATGIALRSRRHYAVALDDVAQNGCAPYAALTGSARFST